MALLVYSIPLIARLAMPRREATLNAPSPV